MKLKNIDRVVEGDVLVISKTTGLRGAYNIGDKFIFDSFNRLEPMSASTIYLKKEGDDEILAFTVGITKNLEPLQVYRNSQLGKLV